jgi:replication-associated recombination protein RarA
MISDWTKKYEPKDFDNLVLIPRILPIIEKWKKIGEVDQNVLLAGSPGFGKTSMAQVIIKTFNPEDFLFLNAGEVLIDDIKGQVDSFLVRAGISGKKKIVIFDEADLLPTKAMDYLKSMIYKYQAKCTFIFTTNNKHLLPIAIMSRFPCQLNLVPENPDEQKTHMIKFFERSVSILEKENVTFDEKIVKKIIIRNYPDYRKTLGELQLAFNTFGEIDKQALDINLGLNNKIIQAMKDKDIEEVIKQIKYVSLTNFFSDFYNNMSKILDKKCLSNVILVLGDYNARQPFDKELNIVACINELIFSQDVNLTWKE